MISYNRPYARHLDAERHDTRNPGNRAHPFFIPLIISADLRCPNLLYRVNEEKEILTPTSI